MNTWTKKEQMNKKQIKEWINKQTVEWKDKWMKEQINVQTNKWTKEQMNKLNI